LGAILAAWLVSWLVSWLLRPVLPATELGNLVFLLVNVLVTLAVIANIVETTLLRAFVGVLLAALIAEHNRAADIDVNPCKEKKLTNMRASGKDENVVCTPVRDMTLEKAIHFIADDEMVEVTPVSIRLRKTVLQAQARHLIAGKRKKKDKK
ncbi:MAG: hypothetical protein R6V15_00240, partial [Desulfotignum sp.]